MAWTHIINPTITHILALTSFLDNDIDTLYKSIHLTIISGSEYNCKWPKVLRYGTYHFCSLQLKKYGIE